MRGIWIGVAVGLAFWALAGEAVRAQAQFSDMETACFSAPGRRLRLESVTQARADVECRADESGRISACAVTRASPDNDTVRYFALQGLCPNLNFDPATLQVDAAGRRTISFQFHFNVECGRGRHAQTCFTSRSVARGDDESGAGVGAGDDEMDEQQRRRGSMRP